MKYFLTKYLLTWKIALKNIESSQLEIKSISKCLEVKIKRSMTWFIKIQKIERPKKRWVWYLKDRYHLGLLMISMFKVILCIFLKEIMNSDNFCLEWFQARNLSNLYLSLFCFLLLDLLLIILWMILMDPFKDHFIGSISPQQLSSC